MDVKELDRTYIAGTYARFPVVLTHGSGSLVYDEDGREYIDMGSGIAVNAFGVADGEWISAVTAQLGKLQHGSNLYYHRAGRPARPAALRPAPASGRSSSPTPARRPTSAP